MVDDWMSMKHWWNARDGKMEGVWKNLSHFHSIHHKSHTGWPGIGSRPPQQEGNKCAPQTWQRLSRAAWHDIRVHLEPVSRYLLIQVSMSHGFLHSQSPKQNNFNFFAFYKLQKIKLTCCFSALRLSSCSLKTTKSRDFSSSSCFVLCNAAIQPSGLSEDASEMTQMCYVLKLKPKFLPLI